MARRTVGVSADDDGQLTAIITSIAFSAGLAGLSISAVTAKNSIEGSVTAAIDGSTVTSNNGGVSVTADSAPTLTTEMRSIAAAAAIGASVSVAIAEEAVTRSVTARVDGSTISSTGGGLSVSGTSTIDAAPFAEVISAAAVSVAVASSKTAIGGTTSAFVAGSTVTGSGVSITAGDIIDAKPTITSAGTGVISVNATNVIAGVTRVTDAYLGAGTTNVGTSTITVIGWSDVEALIDAARARTGCADRERRRSPKSDVAGATKARIAAAP